MKLNENKLSHVMNGVAATTMSQSGFFFVSQGPTQVRDEEGGKA